MKIYYAPNTRAVRIVWLCEELSLGYELHKFDGLTDKRMREPDYLGVHPLGRVPCLEDDGQHIFESGAIVQYILARYGDGKLAPKPSSDEFANFYGKCLATPALRSKYAKKVKVRLRHTESGEERGRHCCEVAVLRSTTTSSALG